MCICFRELEALRKELEAVKAQNEKLVKAMEHSSSLNKTQSAQVSLKISDIRSVLWQDQGVLPRKCAILMDVTCSSQVARKPT